MIIEFKVDTSKTEDIKKAIACLQAMTLQRAELRQDSLAEKKSKPVKSSSPAEERVNLEEPTKKKTTSKSKGITLEDIRAQLELKNEHRPNRVQMKEKLTELGAENTTQLAPEKYEEFYNFLKDLS